MTERALIEGCVNNRQDCQQQLFTLYAGKMMSVCLRYARDEQQAQDFLQEGFIKVFAHLNQYRFEGSFEGWMRRVFVTVAIRQASRNNIRFLEPSGTDSEEQHTLPEVYEKLSANDIHGFIRAMPEGYRTVFNLFVVEGYTHEEIGLMLGIQATTSRGQLLKARKQLQAMIEKNNATVRV